MLTVIAKLLSILNSEDHPAQIAWAVALALWFTLLPLFSGFKWGILLIVCLLRVNLSAFIIAIALFTLPIYLLDPAINHLGYALLNYQPLISFWANLASSGIGSFFAINNTLALAATLIGALLLFPTFWLTQKAIHLYRHYWMAKIEQWHVIQLLKSTKLFKIYQSLN